MNQGRARKGADLPKDTIIMAWKKFVLFFGGMNSFSFVRFQASEVRVNFVVMRPAETQEEGGSGREGQHSRAARRAPEPQYFKRRSTYMKVMHRTI